MTPLKAAGKWTHTRDARGKRVRVRDKSTGAVDWDATRENLRDRGVVVLGAGADEAPQAYKSLPAVLEAHKDSLTVTHWLNPIGVVMAGADEYDPYKD